MRVNRIVEQTHPFELLDTQIAGGQFRVAYRLAGRVTAAHLVGSDFEAEATSPEAGWLVAPLPPKGGGYQLVIDAVEGLVAGWPPLPWELPVQVDQAALAAYLTATPLGAIANLPKSTLVVEVERILREPERVTLFFDLRSNDGAPVWGEVSGRMIVEGDEVRWHSRPFANALMFHCSGQAADLEFQITSYNLWSPKQWQATLDVSAERPFEVKPRLEFTYAGRKLELRRLRLGPKITALDLRGAIRDLDLGTHLRLHDGDGRSYPLVHHRSSWLGDYRLAPVNPGVTQLIVTIDGFSEKKGVEMYLPLQVGAEARGSDTFSFGFDNDDDYRIHPDAISQVRRWLTEPGTTSQQLHFQEAPYASLDPRGSHLGGPPFWPAGEPWPACERCGEALTFVGQLRFGLNDGVHLGGPELLTLHYCTPCLRYGERLEYRLRRYWHVDSTSLSCGCCSVEQPRLTTPCSLLTKEVKTFPDPTSKIPDDLHKLGVRPNLIEHVSRQIPAPPVSGSQFGGYPMTLQREALPVCDHCKQRMTLLCRLDTETAVGLIWPYGFFAQIFICEDRCCNRAASLLLCEHPYPPPPLAHPDDEDCFHLDDDDDCIYLDDDDDQPF